MNSHSARWNEIRALEDALALVNEADQLRRLIRTHSYHEASRLVVFVAAEQQREPLLGLKKHLGKKRYGRLERLRKEIRANALNDKSWLKIWIAAAHQREPLEEL